MSEPIKFNINHYVRVRLTDHGRRILAQQGLTGPTEVEGWSDWQLWNVMNVFGAYVGLGRTLPFETELQIVGDKGPLSMKGPASSSR